MLKLRIIPTLLFDGTTLVKGKKFQSWRTVSSLVQQVRIYALRNVDEMILLDITATNNKEKIDLSLIKDITEDVFMPFTVGGGISKIDDIKNLLSCGADKVAINTAAYENPKFINEAIKTFGSQCIVVSVDYKLVDKKYMVFTNSGKKNTKVELFDYLKVLKKLNIGELLLTSIDRDGTMEGYDIEVVKKANEIMEVPIIPSGGAKNYQDMLGLIKLTNVTALAAASIYHFENQTPQKAKIFLKKNCINVRI